MYALLALLNFLTPKSFGSRRVARGVPYGPHHRQALDIYAPRSGNGPWPVIYFLYGGALAVPVLLIAFALVTSRRRGDPASATAEGDHG
jgi:acetyl esterase/lipase